MQAIILAAGKGTRLGTLTENIPKPMVPINGKPLLAYIIDQLPFTIDEIIIAVGYQGEKIKDYFKDDYHGKLISYVDASDLTGTAGALFKARDILKGKFLVVYGDDFFKVEDLEKLLTYPLAMGVLENVANCVGYVHVETDSADFLTGFRKPTDDEIVHGRRLATGAFVLDERIFKYDPVSLSNGEYSLPHTILRFGMDQPIAVVNTPSWRTVTTPEDVPYISDYLASMGEDG